MQKESNFTHGRILAPLLGFALPILGALVLQAMYGAVDLLVVGQFASSPDVSAVSTGSQLMSTITGVVFGLSTGTTILLGNRIGAEVLERRTTASQEAKAVDGHKSLPKVASSTMATAAVRPGDIIGTAICLFTLLGLILTVILPLMASPLCTLMRAPAEAFDETVSYVTICSLGMYFMMAYNVLGSIFRGMGDSRTPLMAVIIACIINIIGDLLFVAGFNMGAAGAALATVLAQGISVALCLRVISRHGLPFAFSLDNIRLNRYVVLDTLRLGLPLALQDLLVNISFLVLLAIVNSLGLIASAGMGVAEKLCAFIMLVPSASSQALSAFVAQNIGANEFSRAKRSLYYAMAASLLIDMVMAWLAFFHGDLLCLIFSRDASVIAAGVDYLRAYAIDTLLVGFLFCFIGYFNGCGHTNFVMLQGIVGSFCVRIPVSWLMSRSVNVSLFRIGLATPCSTILQIVLCFIYMLLLSRQENQLQHIIDS